MSRQTCKKKQRCLVVVWVGGSVPTATHPVPRLSLSVVTPSCVFVASLITTCKPRPLRVSNLSSQWDYSGGDEGGDGAHVQFCFWNRHRKPPTRSLWENQSSVVDVPGLRLPWSSLPDCGKKWPVRTAQPSKEGHSVKANPAKCRVLGRGGGVNGKTQGLRQGPKKPPPCCWTRTGTCEEHCVIQMAGERSEEEQMVPCAILSFYTSERSNLRIL